MNILLVSRLFGRRAAPSRDVFRRFVGSGGTDWKEFQNIYFRTEQQMKGDEGLDSTHPYSKLEFHLRTKRNSLKTEKKAIGKARFARVVDEDGWGWGRGSRKAARAHVKVKFGNGQFIVNQSNLQTFFSIIHYREWALKPLEVIQGLGKFDVHAYVSGSGHSAKAQAIMTALSRALVSYQPDTRPILESYIVPSFFPHNLLQTDSRQKESSRAGNEGARMAEQWKKR